MTSQLNSNDRLLISTRCIFFLEAHLQRSSRLSMLGREVIWRWVTNREVLPRCAWLRTKCAEKTSVGLWGQFVSLDERPGCYKMVSKPTSYTGMCGSVTQTSSWHTTWHWTHRRVLRGNVNCPNYTITNNLCMSASLAQINFLLFCTSCHYK